MLKPIVKNNYKDILEDSFDDCFAKFKLSLSISLEKVIPGFMEEVDEEALRDYFKVLKNLLMYMKINDPPIKLDL